MICNIKIEKVFYLLLFEFKSEILFNDGEYGKIYFNEIGILFLFYFFRFC